MPRRPGRTRLPTRPATPGRHSDVIAALPAREGYSLIEVVFVTGLIVTTGAMAVPQLLAGVDEYRAAAAARYLSARIQQARMNAVTRSTEVGLQFVLRDGGYAFTEFADGNRNGVRTRDIQRGVDVPIGTPMRMLDQFPGVDFGVLPALPPVDGSSPAPGDDPIKLGSSDILSFSPLGSSSSGSLYLRGRRGAQYVLRVFGETGKVRMLKFSAGRRQWVPL
jgi:type II secretory pathway pseudopilin PulG